MQYMDQNTPQIINESYKIWKNNVPCLYSILQTYQLQSCSQTIDWLSQTYVQNTWRCMNLFIGTNSITNNAVYQLNMYVPTNESDVSYCEYSETKPEHSPGSVGYVGTMGQQNVSVKNTLHQDSEVMKVRVSKATKEKENFVAVKTGGSCPGLYVYDINHPDADLQNHKIELMGHQAEGYGLSWNNEQWNVLASCSYDRKILVWDINQSGKEIAPLKEIRTSEVLEEIKWMHGNSNVFCVGSQSKQISLYDVRENTQKPSLTKTAHNGEIYSLDFNRFAHNLLLSGSQQSDIFLWDIRNMSKKYNSFIGHNDSITCLQWSPTKQTQFASSSSDRKIVMWNIDQIGSQMTEQQKQQQNKTEEIGFIHNGHRSRVTDFCYSGENGLMGSVEEGNVLQVWQVGEEVAGRSR